MKNTNLFLFIALTTLMACGGALEEENTIPEDLEGKQALLKSKRAELRELTVLINDLEKAIAEQDPRAVEKPKRLVTTFPVTKETFQHYVELQATVQANDLIDVTSEASGIITEMPLREGDYVKKGQLVARLDLEQLNKQLAELEKSKELADIVFERQKRLWDQNIGSEIQYLEAKNNKEMLEKSIETLQFQQSKATITSPASGVVERVVLKSGELASPGAPIIQILDPSRLKVVADVPENLLTAVKRGDKIEISYPAINMEQTARVNLIGRTIDQANRTFEIEMNVGSKGGLLKPNLLANVLINDFTQEDAIIVPLDAIQEEVGGKKYVFVQHNDGDGMIAKKVYIKTGESYRGNIIVTQGLSGDETVILDGARGLADSEPIQVKQILKKESING